MPPLELVDGPPSAAEVALSLRAGGHPSGKLDSDLPSPGDDEDQIQEEPRIPALVIVGPGYRPPRAVRVSVARHHGSASIVDDDRLKNLAAGDSSIEEGDDVDPAEASDSDRDHSIQDPKP